MLTPFHPIRSASSPTVRFGNASGASQQPSEKLLRLRELASSFEKQGFFGKLILIPEERIAVWNGLLLGDTAKTTDKTEQRIEDAYAFCCQLKDKLLPERCRLLQERIANKGDAIRGTLKPLQAHLNTIHRAIPPSLVGSNNLRNLLRAALGWRADIIDQKILVRSPEAANTPPVRTPPEAAVNIEQQATETPAAVETGMDEEGRFICHREGRPLSPEERLGRTLVNQALQAPCPVYWPRTRQYKPFSKI